MSETVHYRGKLEQKIVGFKNCEKFAKKEVKEDFKSYYSNYIEQLCDTTEDYFYHHSGETLYKIIHRIEHDLDEEIITANRFKNGIIEFELRYYNGGAGFTECLEEALDKLD